MKKLTIVSGIQGTGKTTYINNLKKRIPEDETYIFEEKPIISKSIVMKVVNPIVNEFFALGVIDDILMTTSEIIDLLFINNYYLFDGKTYATHFIVSTQIPKSEFPVSFLNHHEVDFIELPRLLNKKDTEQKVKDFLYSQATPEVLKAVEHLVENPIPPIDHPTHVNVPWKIEMTLIPGMIAPKK